ncbi:MAG: hypothetical protein IJ800_06405 [Clostridia bacterium]|nr:hypothetical protein [Clostridia bacterium]
MKYRYKYKFSFFIIVVFVLFYIVAGALFVWNLIRLINSLQSPIQTTVYNYISIGLCIILPIAFGAEITAAIVSSDYTIKDKTLTVNFGFIKEVFQVSEIEAVVKNVRYNKLGISFKDGSSYRIVIDEKQFDDFSSQLIKTNKFISYGETDAEEKRK